MERKLSLILRLCVFYIIKRSTWDFHRKILIRTGMYSHFAAAIMKSTDQSLTFTKAGIGIASVTERSLATNGKTEVTHTDVKSRESIKID